MKITKTQLKRIIKEELQQVLNEGDDNDGALRAIWASIDPLEQLVRHTADGRRPPEALASMEQRAEKAMEDVYLFMDRAGAGTLNLEEDTVIYLKNMAQVYEALKQQQFSPPPRADVKIQLDQLKKHVGDRIRGRGFRGQTQGLDR